MLNLSSQMGVIPNETKYNKAWQRIVNDTGPTVFSHEENKKQSQQIATASAKKEKPLMITADNNVELMIPPNPAQNTANNNAELMIPDNPAQSQMLVNVTNSNLHIPAELANQVSPNAQRQIYYDIKKELDIARIQATMQGSNDQSNLNESEESEKMPLTVYKGIQDKLNNEESELRTLLEQFREATATQQAELAKSNEAQLEHEELQNEYLRLKNQPPLGAIFEQTEQSELAGTRTLGSNQTPTIDFANAGSFKLGDSGTIEESGTFRQYRSTIPKRAQSNLSEIKEERKKADESHEHRGDEFFLTQQKT